MYSTLVGFKDAMNKNTRMVFGNTRKGKNIRDVIQQTDL